MEILKNISFSEILLIYLLYDFGVWKRTYPKVDYQIKNSDDCSLETHLVKPSKSRSGLLSSNFNIHTLRKRLKYVDDYFFKAQNIKDKALNLKNSSREETGKFIIDKVSNSLGVDIGAIEKILDMMPLLKQMENMVSFKDKDKTNSFKQEEFGSETTLEEKENKEYNDILSLLDLLN